MVLDPLCEEVKKFQRKKQSYCGSCVLLLVYVYIIRVRVEGLVVLDVVPRTAGLSDELVHERITICKAIGGLACGEVVPGRGRVVGEGAGPTHNRDTHECYKHRDKCVYLPVTNTKLT